MNANEKRIADAIKVLHEMGVDKVFIIAEDTATVDYDDAVSSELPYQQTITFQ